MSATIHIKEGQGWYKFQFDRFTVWLKGYLLESQPIPDIQHLAHHLSTLTFSPDAFRELLTGLDGHFAMIVQTPDWTLAAVDPCRSIPLSFGTNKHGWHVDDQATRLARHLNLGTQSLNVDTAFEVAHSGFSLAGDTLYNGLESLIPGSFALFAGGRLARRRYTEFAPWIVRPRPRALLMQDLHACLQHSLHKTLRNCRNAPLVVHLDHSMASKILISALKDANIENVRLYSYGLEHSAFLPYYQAISQHTGYPWLHIPIAPDNITHLLQSQFFLDLLASVDTACATPALDGVYALAHLHQQPGLLPPGAVFLSHAGGTFLAGEDLPETFAALSPTSGQLENQEMVIATFVEKRFKNWASLHTPENTQRIRRLIFKKIIEQDYSFEDPDSIHGIYQALDFESYQSKYALNALRIIEFFGSQWRLPLWQRDLMAFWQYIPAELKSGERLLHDTMMHYNWGNMWQSQHLTPPEKKRGSLANSIMRGFAPWAKAAARAYLPCIEMDPAAPPPSYTKDKRSPTSSLAPHTEAYLHSHGVLYNGTIAEDRWQPIASDPPPRGF